MWKYQELLNQNLQILIALAVGYLTVLLRALDQKTDIHAINKVIFYILIPSAVLLALGLNTNLHDGDVWRFVGGFLLLRAICLVLVWFFHGLLRRQSIAYVTIQWMVTCWVSTVVLGIPLLIATLGPQYGSLGAVAAISSFIFQLPLMLIFLEGSADTSGFEERAEKEDAVMERGADVDSIPDGEADDLNGNTLHRRHFTLRLTKAQLRYIGIKLLKNPILWAIVIGFILSITTLGPRYLSPGNPPLNPNCDYAVGAGFIQLTLKYFAACTEPIALLAVGMFLYAKNPFACGILPSIAYMIVKLILVPGLMVGCAFAVGLSGAEGRAAVLLASLPVSPTSYTVSDKYGTGRAVAEANVFWGNVLVLPTTIAWNAFMDSINLFEFPDPPSLSSNPACSAA
jgi:predicted permease